MTQLAIWPRVTSMTPSAAAFVIDINPGTTPITKSILASDAMASMLAGSGIRLDSSTDGSLTTVIGENCLPNGGTCKRSLYLGEAIATANAMNNDGVGGDADISGNDNVFIGAQMATNVISPARRNVGVGSYCLEDLTSGYANIAIGYRPCTNVTTGCCNVGIGDGALMCATDSYNNTGVGIEAGLSIGYSALVRDATCYGFHAGYGDNDFTLGVGSWSTWVGSQSGGAVRAVTTNENTTAIGAYSGYSGGANCVFVGYSAGRRSEADNEFFLDALDRSSRANELTQSLLYGTFHATPSSQTLQVNGKLIAAVESRHNDGVKAYFGTDSDAYIEDTGTIFNINSGSHVISVTGATYFRSAARVEPVAGNAVLYVTGAGSSGFDITNDTAGDTYIYNRTAGKNIYWYTGGTQRMIVGAAGLTLSDAQNIVVNATTGTKIGTATTQKLGFWNATPVVQPTAVADATGAGDVVAQLNALLAKLRTIGVIAT